MKDCFVKNAQNTTFFFYTLYKAYFIKLYEKSGILQRTPCPEDARIREISLTEKGVVLDERLKEYITNLEEELLSGFSPEEKDILRSLLSRLSENMEKAERNRV